MVGDLVAVASRPNWDYLRDRLRRIDDLVAGAAVEALSTAEADALRVLGRTPEMIALFGDRLGVPYPYPKYAQVVVENFIFGGMENTSATTLEDTMLLDTPTETADVADNLVAHELGGAVAQGRFLGEPRECA